MIHLTFPDGTVREYQPGITGAELAASISKSLAKKAVAISLDGQLADLADPIAKSGRLKVLTRDDPEALELIRHEPLMSGRGGAEPVSRHPGHHRPGDRERLLLRLLSR